MPFIGKGFWSNDRQAAVGVKYRYGNRWPWV